ncbi:MAG: acyl-ACP--UDP-N-acetylglucosamine O-acyltransferase [Rhodospirillum sp.]|nr:acyl-ACP--UDP-N-acetylglucosamine O-acyltransferase [Rhodospirillum sp.]MCF8488449.1 acyl-ACP--UDP-N-acetylglucosamine O-acyltransferase [Rhodospirillum sp.]MCF8499111.1 acyl-ACP--UDP-N-acetylglucosamine O-acyltransferase [Rhodospirillum sp.]
MPSLHPSSIVDPKAQLADSVVIGPFCTVGPDVVLGEGVELVSHVVVDGHTTIGKGTRIFPFSSIGVQPQDLKFHGEVTYLEIGENNTIREHVTMNPGTEGGGGLTRVGSGGLFMVGVHLAHDCLIGDNVVFANNAILAGHVEVDNQVVIGGGAAVHQFVRIGKHAMVGGASAVERDVIPFGTVVGNRATLEGMNVIGMKRRGFTREELHAVRDAIRILFSGNEVINQVPIIEAAYPDSPSVAELLAFVRGETRRGLIRPGDDAQV